jgi:hypothetical protein
MLSLQEPKFVSLYNTPERRSLPSLREFSLPSRGSVFRTVFHNKETEEKKPVQHAKKEVSGGGDDQDPFAAHVRFDRKLLKVGWGIIAANYLKGVGLLYFAPAHLASTAVRGFTGALMSSLVVKMCERRLGRLTKASEEGLPLGENLVPSTPMTNKINKVLGSMWLGFGGISLLLTAASLATGNYYTAASVFVNAITEFYWGINIIRDLKFTQKSPG